MDAYGLMKGIIFLILTIIGIFGNVIIIYFYGTFCLKEKVKTSELITGKLAWANLISVLTRGLPRSLFVFGLQNLFNDIGCKLVVFASRLSRAMSLCLTCLLSCFQCAVLLSSNHNWASVKIKLQKFLPHIFALLLLMNSLVYVSRTMCSVSGRNSSHLPYTSDLGYCLIIFPDKVSLQANGFASFTRDMVFVIFMAMASAKMLLVLYWHGKRVQGMRSSDNNQESRMESKAAKTISTLVGLYIFFFGVDSTIWLYQATVSDEVHVIVTDVRTFFSVCYSSVFPIVIIISNTKVKTKLKYRKSEQEKTENIAYIH
ncbi:olfactory receptor class A-like protein 1 [Protopterus annectens]|uniref:olfactory receptor class A-like protein 1 n=1 Tax=Protopterus annectens TaxID=7888 RepID=UPI001CFB5B19|nr:olfactory receptor class A-like protein 1 [Protopterus annectens]